MHFALIDDKHTEPAPDLKGAVCPGCGAPVIAKCGTQKVHHWAHRNTKMCDSWWETETGWHRKWKNNFPVEWQEVFLPDKQTGEKHIADVCTEHGLVIEFQHSHIKPEERISRERFYKNMVWVVDGTRLKKDYLRFVEASGSFRETLNERVFKVAFPENCFPRNWIESSVPVIFDFLGLEPLDEIDDTRNDLYCLSPDRLGSYAIVRVIPRESFINEITNNEWKEPLSGIEEGNQEKQQPKKLCESKIVANWAAVGRTL